MLHIISYDVVAIQIDIFQQLYSRYHTHNCVCMSTLLYYCPLFLAQVSLCVFVFLVHVVHQLLMYSKGLQALSGQPEILPDFTTDRKSTVVALFVATINIGQPL